MNSDNAKINAILHMGKPDKGPWLDYEKLLDLSTSDVPDIVDVLTNHELHIFESSDPRVWAPLHAWRALGLLRNADAIPALISCFDYMQDDDWAIAELPKVFTMIGPSAIPPLKDYFCEDAEKHEFSLILAIDSLAAVALAYPEHRDQVVSIFTDYLKAPHKDFDSVNGSVIGQLIHLHGKEAINEIRYLFHLGCVDLSWVGDLEDVEIALGFKEERTTPPTYLDG